jgi:D-alanyl-D-alanine carboxypeptidase
VDGRITIRQLLNHTSGLYMPVEHPDSPFRKPYNSIEFDKWWTLEEIFDTLIEEPYFPPGGGWHYTQTGYYLGVLIIEHVTHSTVPRELQHRLLDPLNIDGMLLDLSRPVPPEYKVAHHWVDTDGNGLYEDVSSRSLNWICSLSRILYYANPGDMARWMHALFNEQVVNRSSLKEMLEFISPTPGEPMLDGYGLGTLRIIVEGTEFWGHGGSIPGYRTMALHSSEYGATVALMINTDGDPVMDAIAFPLLVTLIEHLR